MKRIMILLLTAILLLVAGCGAKVPEAAESVIPATEATIPATEAPTEAPTEPPTTPVPTCVDAQVVVDYAPAVLMLLNPQKKISQCLKIITNLQLQMRSRKIHQEIGGFFVQIAY